MTDYRMTVGSSTGKPLVLTQAGAPQTAGPFDEIPDAIGGAVDEAGDTFGDIGSGIGNAAGDLGGSIGNVGNNIGDFGGDFANNLSSGLGNLGGGLGGAFQGLGEFGADVGGGLGSAFEGAADFGGDVGGGLGSAFEGAADFGGDVGGGAVDLATDFGGGVSGAAGEVADFTADSASGTLGFTGDVIEGGVNLGTDFGGGVGDVAEGVADFTADSASGTVDFTGDVIEGGVDLTTDIGSGVGSAAEGAIEFGGDIVDDSVDLTTDIGSGVGDAAEGTLEFGGDLLGDAGSVTTDIAGGFADSAYAVGNATKEAAYAGGSAINSLTEGVVGGLGAGAAAVGEGTANTLAGIANATASAVNVILKGAGKTLGKLGGGTGGGVQWGKLENVWSAQDPNGGGCVVKKQQSDNGATRYFFAKVNADETGRFERGNSSITFSELQQGINSGQIKSLDSVPSFETLEDATEYATSNYCTGADTATDSQDNEEVWMGLGDKQQDAATNNPSCNVYSIASQTGTTKYVTQVFVDGPSLESGTVAKAVSQQQAVTGFMGSQEFYEIAGPGEEPNLNEIEWGRIPKFDTVAQAESACVSRVPERAQGGDSDSGGTNGGGSGNSGTNGGGGSSWSEPQVIETVDSLGVEVIGRERDNGDRQFFVKDIGAEVVYTKSGKSVKYTTLDTVPPNATLAEQDIEPTLKAIEERRQSEGGQGGDSGGSGGQGGDSGGSGETTWSDPQQVETVRDAVILEQQSSNGETRYFAVTKVDGQTVALAAPNDAVPVNGVDSWDQLPHFPTVEEARAVVPQKQSNTQPPARGGIPDNRVSNGDQSQDTQWSEPQPVAESENCVFLGQQGSGGSKRFFTTTKVNGQVVAVGADGSAAVAMSNVQSLDNVPSYSTAEEAQAACPSQGQTIEGQQPQKPTANEVSSRTRGLDNGGSGGGFLSNNLLLIGGVAAAGVGGLVLLSSEGSGSSGRSQSDNGGGLFSDDNGGSDNGGGLFSDNNGESGTGTGQTQEQGGVFQ